MRIPVTLVLITLGLVAVPSTAASAASLACSDGPAASLVASPGSSVDGRPDPSAAQTAAWERATLERSVPAPDDRRRVVVPVVWHVVEAGPTFEQGHLERRTVRQAIKQVGRGYRGAESEHAARTPFRFDLVKITRTVDARFFTDLRWNSPTEKKMKAQLRTGGAETLNIYTVRPVAGIGGWATFPQEYPDAPHMDGVVIHYGATPGGPVGGGQGDILTHEIGHWLGLYHTFQDGCSEPGDHVDDTPYEASSASDCAEARDTCPAPGDDPVHNYMDYATDQCKDQLTPGQRDRAVRHWDAWRAPRG